MRFCFTCNARLHRHDLFFQIQIVADCVVADDWCVVAQHNLYLGRRQLDGRRRPVANEKMIYTKER